jgi:DNA-binding NarL/FixJ family response regulator
MTAWEHKRGNAEISIAIVDRQPLFRMGVAHALGSQTGIQIVDQGETGTDALQIAGSRPVDIMLLDPNVQGGGMQMLSSLTRSWPVIKLVVLTASEQEEDVSSALRCGARGYLLKHVKDNELVTALRAVAQGEVYLTPSLGARLFARTAAGTSTSTSTGLSSLTVANLTPRENQILTQVSLGATNKEIAISLNISEKTVKYYMTNIMQKLQVRNRVEAVIIMRDKARMLA